MEVINVKSAEVPEPIELTEDVEIEPAKDIELCASLGQVACAGCSFLKLCKGDVDNFVQFNEESVAPEEEIDLFASDTLPELIVESPPVTLKSKKSKSSKKPDPIINSEPYAEVKIKTHPELKPIFKPELRSRPKTKADPQPKIRFDTKVEFEPKPEIKTEIKAKLKKYPTSDIKFVDEEIKINNPIEPAEKTFVREEFYKKSAPKIEKENAIIDEDSQKIINSKDVISKVYFKNNTVHQRPTEHVKLKNEEPIPIEDLSKTEKLVSKEEKIEPEPKPTVIKKETSGNSPSVIPNKSIHYSKAPNVKNEEKPSFLELLMDDEVESITTKGYYKKKEITEKKDSPIKIIEKNPCPTKNGVKMREAKRSKNVNFNVPKPINDHINDIDVNKQEYKVPPSFDVFEYDEVVKHDEPIDNPKVNMETAETPEEEVGGEEMFSASVATYDDEVETTLTTLEPIEESVTTAYETEENYYKMLDVRPLTQSIMDEDVQNIRQSNWYILAALLGTISLGLYNNKYAKRSIESA